MSGPDGRREMKPMAPALVIPLIVLLQLSGFPLSSPVLPAAFDSVALRAASDTALALRIEETGVRLGSRDLREPTGVAVGSRGFVYVADAMAGKVFRYSPDGTSLELERPPDDAAFYPIDVADQEAYVFVLDYSRNALLRYTHTGAYLDVLLSFDQFNSVHPVSVTGGVGGRILTADVTSHTVTLWTPLFAVELTIGDFGTGEGRFNEPRGAAFLPNNGIVVVESGNRRLQYFSPSGRYERMATPPAETPFVFPRSVCVDEAGAVFVCDAGAGRVFIFDSGGSFVTDIHLYGGEAISPAAAVAAWDGTLYVADLKSRSILVYRVLHPRGK
jgi:tripartite motif-containing protein 71